MTPALPDLKRLSTMLDQALDLPAAQREAWLASLAGDDAALAPTLRELLARQARHETGELIDRLPAFTIAPEPAAAPALAAGDTVGPYRLQRELGHGGMGEVWLAERVDGQLKRTVALKLPMLQARRSVLVQRFARERDILGALAHPHIARLYDAGLADDGQPYLALEYVEGQPITAYCDEHRLDARARIALLRQVMAAVQFAHANLVVHRDLKPSNVLVTRDGQAMLLDFGIAKLLQDEQAQAQETELTQLGGRALTLGYAAPEQITGAPVSIATDVYALGVLLYELLAGRRPFVAGTRAALEQAVLSEEPQRPSQRRGGVIEALPRTLCSDIDSISLKALKKTPAERYATVAALIEDLDRFERGEPVHAQPDSRWYRARKFVARHRIALGVGATTAGLMLTAAGIAVWQGVAAREQAELARKEAQRAAAVQTFLVDMFRANSNEQPDPQRARATTARELLDLGLKRIDQSLKDVPEAKDEVLLTMADMYFQLGLKDRSAQLLWQRVESARALNGPQHRSVADALLRYVDAVSDGPSTDELAGHLAQARAILEHLGDRDSELRGYLSLLEAIYFSDRSLSRMRASADEAVAIAERRAGSDINALRFAALARLRAGFAHEADGLMRRLLAEVDKKKEAADAWRVTQLGVLGDVELAQLRFADAMRSTELGEQISLRLDGPTHTQTLYAAGATIHMLARSGQPGVAERRMAALERLVADIEPKPAAYLTIYLRSVAASIALDRGRFSDALRDIDAAIDYHRAQSPHSSVIAARLRARADALLGLDRADEAAQAAEQGAALWRRFADGSDHPSARNADALLKARIELARGHASGALAALEQLVPPPNADRLPHRIDRLKGDLIRAHGLLVAHQPEKARAFAQRVADEVTGSELRPHLPALEADAMLALGMSQASVDRAGACSSLRAAQAIRRQHDHPSSPRLAAIGKAAAASCGGTIRTP